SEVREEAPQGARFDSVVTGRLPPTRERLFSVAPRGALLTPGWNLFLIRDFGQIGGGVFYVDIPGVVLAERGMGIELAPGERGGATLAHELGHSLGLEHHACDESRNIMANRCWSPTTLSALTAQQIALARRQATAGHPITEEPWARPR
ncbi:MAG: hypothetical protein ACREMV_06285, partial [Gemmatimonadales bacterium]